MAVTINSNNPLGFRNLDQGTATPSPARAANNPLRFNNLGTSSGSRQSVAQLQTGGATISDRNSLAQNKRVVSHDLDALGATEGEKQVIMAMLMQETTHLRPDESVARSGGQKGGGAANASIANLSKSMMQALGYHGSLAALNNPKNLPTVLSYMKKAIERWGVRGTLNYERGGSTAFHDGRSYGATQYRNLILSAANRLRPADMTNGRRVAANLHGV